MLQVSCMLGIDHLTIGTWFTELRMRLVECTVSTLEQVALGVLKSWIAITMTIAILVTQKPHPGRIEQNKSRLNNSACSIGKCFMAKWTVSRSLWNCPFISPILYNAGAELLTYSSFKCEVLVRCKSIENTVKSVSFSMKMLLNIC
jgi:hypothetical protein